MPTVGVLSIATGEELDAAEINNYEYFNIYLTVKEEGVERQVDG